MPERMVQLNDISDVRTSRTKRDSKASEFSFVCVFPDEVAKFITHSQDEAEEWSSSIWNAILWAQKFDIRDPDVTRSVKDFSDEPEAPDIIPIKESEEA